MLPATIERLDALWATWLGCGAADLDQGETVVVPHGAMLADYAGIFIFRRRSACIVSAPAARVTEATRAVQGRAPDEVFAIEAVARAFGPAAGAIIGPAWLGYVDAGHFRPAAREGARALMPEDASALQALEAACSPMEWEHSGIDHAHRPLFGCFRGDALVAAGTCPLHDHQAIRNIGVLTHPAYRGNGFGRTVVSAMTAYGLAEERIVGYRTLQTNLPSLRIARSLGYHGYALTIAVRLVR